MIIRRKTHLLPFSSASERSPTDFFAISRKDLAVNAERTDPMRPTLKAVARPMKATQRRFIIMTVKWVYLCYMLQLKTAMMNM